MVRILTFAAFLMATAIGLGLGKARADQAPVLRSEISTLSEIVTIGDFYSFAGIFADTPLFRAPDLGVTGSVPAEDVARRARAAGLIKAGTDGLKAVTVHRRAELYDQHRLERITAAALAERGAGLSADDLDIKFYRELTPLQADPSDPNPVRVDQILWSRNDGRFTLTLSVAGTKGRQQYSLTGYANEMMEVAVLSRPLNRGTIVREGDFTTQRLQLQNVPARALRNPDEVVGLAAKSNLRPNRPITKSDFERPILVSRNEKITITFQMPGMKLTTRGQAMEEGSEGDIIDIMNLQSRRIVPGIVVSRGQVRVPSPAAQVASLEGPLK